MTYKWWVGQFLQMVRIVGYFRCRGLGFREDDFVGGGRGGVCVWSGEDN